MQEMLSFMRSPDKTLPESVKQAWESIQDADRAKEDAFQTGHMLGIYWETVAR